MDPLSISAGVACLGSLTIQLVQISTKYAANSKARQLYDFIGELNALADVLKRLKEFLDTQLSVSSLNQVSVLIATNTRCKNKLQELLQKLRKTVLETNKVKRAIDTILWPLSEREHRDTVGDIHRYTHIFHFALTIEGCSLLAKSSTEVGDSLKEQSQKLENLLLIVPPPLVFLLARLQLDQIITAITIRQIRQMLGKLSSRLFDMYHHTLQRIQQQPKTESTLGMRAISWVAHIKRPLTVPEFVQALSIEKGDQSLDDSGIIDISTILEACVGLLHLQSVSSYSDIDSPLQFKETVHFVYYTMQEYLSEYHAGLGLSSHCDIANTCLTYLCFEEFRIKASHHSYNSYAAAFWSAHAAVVIGSLRYDLGKVLLSPRYPWLSRTWIQLVLRGTIRPLHGVILRSSPLRL